MSESRNNKNLFTETLSWILNKLNHAGIRYMITGGSAVGFWGHIRTTMDIDILIQISDVQTDKLIKSISGEAYVDAENAAVAIASRTMFNVIFNKTCFKIDFIPVNEKIPYEMEKFKRRVRMKFEDMDICVISPEDLIISKLLWMKSAGGSERQLEDCKSIFELNRESTDSVYMEKWARTLGIEAELNGITGQR